MRVSRPLAPVRALNDEDAGFTLVETIVAIVLLALVMAGTLPFFITALADLHGQVHRQVAVGLADQALDYTRALRTPDLRVGRTPTAVAALHASGTTLVSTANVDTTSADAIAATTDASGAIPTVPLSQATTVDGIAYTVKTFVDACWLDEARGSNAADTLRCRSIKSGADSSLTYRVSVEVVWKRGNESCRGATAGTCSYVVDTLRDATPRVAGYEEPVFNTGASTPVLSSVSVSSVHINDTVTATITGQGFQANAQVSSSGTGSATATTVISPTSATFTFSAGAVAGTASIRLVNPDGGGSSTRTIQVTS